jgi:hypothetical protein
VPGNRERRRPGQFRICGKCGKRNKSRRLECSRCAEPLRGLPEATPGKVAAPPPPPRQYRWLVIGVVLVAVAAGFLVHRIFRSGATTAEAVPSAPPPETPSSLPTARPTFDPTSAERVAQAKGSVDRGQRLLARGDFRGAAAQLAEAARLVPEDARIANAYGRALLGLGSRDRALHQFERAARLDSGVVAFRLDYAQALSAARRPREAAREYEAVNMIEPGNVAASEGLARLQQAVPGAEGTGVDMGGASSGATGTPTGGAFTNEDLARGVRPMRPPSPLAPSSPSPRPLSVSTPSPRPLSVSSPSPRPLSLSSPSPRPLSSPSPYSGPFSSPAPL